VSPFDGPKEPDSTDEERRAAEDDLERIRQGGIPLRAEQRLKRISNASTPFFTSDLSAKEYALAQASGLKPVALVTGSSVVQRSWLQNEGVSLANRGASLVNRAKDYGAERLNEQGFNVYNQSFNVGHGLNVGSQGLYYTSGEIPALAEPWNLARNRAFNRLGTEASLAGADGVIGIEMNTEPDPESGMIELVVFGTAVRDTAPSTSDWPYMSMCTLSGQDVDKLRRVGASPRGVVGHTVVYSVQLSPDSDWVMNSGRLFSGGARANVEITEIAQGVSDARDRVMLELRRQANDLSANCIVVSTLRHTIEHYEYEQSSQYVQADQYRQGIQFGQANDYKYHYFHVTMHVLGTAIAVGDRDPYPTSLPQPMMSINLGS
jgi:uncharacterized protein YbjQ (UPF0145 family)